jgi:hypothetical protein
MAPSASFRLSHEDAHRVSGHVTLPAQNSRAKFQSVGGVRGSSRFRGDAQVTARVELARFFFGSLLVFTGQEDAP